MSKENSAKTSPSQVYKIYEVVSRDGKRFKLALNKEGVEEYRARGFLVFKDNRR